MRGGGFTDKDVTRVVTPYKSRFFAVMLCECILAAVVIAGVISVKFFMPKTFKSLKKWYAENIAVDTSAEEIIKGIEYEI